MEQVYIFDFGDRIKVGYSTNVKKRLRTIELSSGQKAKNVFAVDGGKDIEALAHAWLSNRLEGEFFAHPYGDAVELVKKIVAGEIKFPPFRPKKQEGYVKLRINVKEGVIFHDRLRAARIFRGYTLQRTADIVDVPLRSYQKYESADSEPDFSMLVKLADLFDVSTDFLLGRDDYLKKLGVHVDVPPEGPPRHPKPRTNR